MNLDTIGDGLPNMKAYRTNLNEIKTVPVPVLIFNVVAMSEE